MNWGEESINTAGFEVDSVFDGTMNMATMASAWHTARAKHANALREIEGSAAFEGQQTFFEVAARLASEKRLSRLAFYARKREEFAHRYAESAIAELRQSGAVPFDRKRHPEALVAEGLSLEDFQPESGPPLENRP